MSDERKKRLVLVAFTVAALIATGVVVAIKLSSVAGDLVKVELRGKPVASIKMDGKSVGRTPLTLNMKPSQQPVQFEATFELHLFNPMTNAKRTVIKKLTKSVIPDQPQSVDFDIKHAKEVETR